MKTKSSNIPAPAEITPALIQQVSDAVGDLVGWDFSRAVVDREPTPWQYTTIVEQFLQPTARVLDIGTGGGEIFLVLSSRFREGVAIDQSERQIATALANQARAVEYQCHLFCRWMPAACSFLRRRLIWF